MENIIDIEYVNFPITVQIDLVKGIGAFVAVKNRLKIFLLYQRRYQVVVFPLARPPVLEKLVQSFRPLKTVARPARPHLVMYPLYRIAAFALRPHSQRSRHNVFFHKLLNASAVSASLFRLDKLPVLARYHRPRFDSALQSGARNARFAIIFAY
jgi:hypothetical protein